MIMQGIYQNHNRQKTEQHIIQFLASLKYFTDYWLRAKQYAFLVGLLQNEDSKQRSSGTFEMRSNSKINDGKIDELDTQTNNIFEQEFFFHSYSLVTKDRRNF